MVSTDTTEGRFHCLKCGRRHNRGSDIGAFHHRPLDVERKGFDPETAAVGIAFVNAAADRRRPEATAEEIRQLFEQQGFREQFPGLDIEAIVRSWKGQGLIGDARHSGKHWYLFLANRRTAVGADRSPESFHLLMKRFASELERANVR